MPAPTFLALERRCRQSDQLYAHINHSMWTVWVLIRYKTCAGFKFSLIANVKKYKWPSIFTEISGTHSFCLHPSYTIQGPDFTKPSNNAKNTQVHASMLVSVFTLLGLLQQTTTHRIAESNRNLSFWEFCRLGVRNQSIGRVALLSEHLLHASLLCSGGCRHSWIYRCIAPSSISMWPSPCVYVFMWLSPYVCVSSCDLLPVS